MEFTDGELDIITFGLEDHAEKLAKINERDLPQDMQRAKRIAQSDTAVLLNRVKATLRIRRQG